MADVSPTASMSLDEFEQRLLDGERWVELIDGRFLQHDPPDDAHGDVVRNLARSLAAYLKKSTDLYACFELPLVIQADPPTVRCPAVSCFRFEPGNRFAETDKVLTETRPVLVVEVASSNDRRVAMKDRVQAYFEWGVEAVWVIDPIARNVHQIQRGDSDVVLKEPQILLGQRILSGFAMPVSDLFRPPKWLNP